jgi:hypothetical protein
VCRDAHPGAQLVLEPGQQTRETQVTVIQFSAGFFEFPAEAQEDQSCSFWRKPKEFFD